MGKDITKLAMETHGLKPEHILSAKMVGDVAVLVTAGGQKIRWREGEKPVEIPAHQHPDAKPIVKKAKK